MRVMAAHIGIEDREFELPMELVIGMIHYHYSDEIVLSCHGEDALLYVRSWRVKEWTKEAAFELLIYSTKEHAVDMPDFLVWMEPECRGLSPWVDDVIKLDCVSVHKR